MLILIIFSFPSCNALKKVYTGIGKTEITVRDSTEVLKYYDPFLTSNNYQTKVYVLSSFKAADIAVNSFSVPRILLENEETGNVYELDCFGDIEANITDINNGIIDDYLISNKNEDFENLKLFLNNEKSSKLIFNSKEVSLSKKWNIYISYATFMGKKLRRLTLPVTKLNDINKIIILDLSVHKSALEIN